MRGLQNSEEETFVNNAKEFNNKFLYALKISNKRLIIRIELRSLIKRVTNLKDAIIEITENILSLSISTNYSSKDFKLTKITNAKS